MKEKRIPKTQEQIVRELEVSRKRDIVVTHFYPALSDATVSVDEAKMFLQATSAFIMEELLDSMKKRRFAEISKSLITKLCPTGERLAEVTKLLNVLDGENFFVAREIIEGMTNAINQMLQDESQKRKLSELTPDWDKMLNR